MNRTDVMPLSVEELDRQFTYHAPHGDQTERYQRLRESAKAFAVCIAECVPSCADRSAAIRHVREAVMTANAGIAITESIGTFEAVTK